MTDQYQLKELFLKEYVAKIMGFAYIKTSNKEQAEELTQNICIEIIKAMKSGKKIENLNAFVWKVSNNIFCRWLSRHKRGTTFYLTGLELSPDCIEDYYEEKEENAILRRELSFLSKAYREVIIMHYFDGKTCEEIAKLKNAKIGTVKWWLYDARKFIKEGMNKMREYGEKSYRPGSLYLSCQGSPGANFEPMTCASRKSSQNLLLATYKSPMSIEELSLELGISAPYVEDEVNFLVKNQLMKEVSKGRFITDFVILPGNNFDITDKIYTAVFPEYYTKLIDFAESKRYILESHKFNTAGFKWNRLPWVMNITSLLAQVTKLAPFTFGMAPFIRVVTKDLRTFFTIIADLIAAYFLIYPMVYSNYVVKL